jgi:alkyl hydroperoxide reductase subunit AhpF
MFTAVEKKQIAKLNECLSSDISIRLIVSQDPNYKLFKEFCDDLLKLAPRIKIAYENDTPQLPPQIQIGSGLHYQAVPSAHELQPFLEALITLDNESSRDTSRPIKARLKKDKLPATLSVFIAPQCTFCPTVVRQLIALPMVDDKIQLTIIDGTLFPEAAQAHRVQSVPTVLLDDQFRWTGFLPLEELIDTINNRDPASLGAASLENILKEGQAGRLAAMMAAAGKIFPSFYELIIHEKWPVRLGAMVVMEEIADRNPVMAAEVLSFLWDRFQGASDPIKGDILYMFGEIGNRRAVSWLNEVLTGDYDSEVQEAAGEALEKLIG